MRKPISSLILLSLFFACAPSPVLFQPVDADVQRLSAQGKTTDLATLEKGHQLYQANCGKCHSLEAPPRRSMASWNHILPEMFPKTKLTSEECDLVRTYIEARR